MLLSPTESAIPRTLELGQLFVIYFACPAPGQPAGGVEKIYQFADALESASIRAAVVHTTRSKPTMWFKTSTTVLLARDVAFDPSSDVLVVPEKWAYSASIPSGSSIIVLNQGAYLTFDRQELPSTALPLLPKSDSIYEHPGLLGIVCVSADNEALLRFSFPQASIERVQVGIDTTTFTRGEPWREPILGFMPRRRKPEIVELLRILERRGRITSWSPLAIDGVDQQGVGAALRRTAIFLNFPIREGFPLPPLEAMASGCCVVGYDGRGGSEYMTAEVSFPVPEGDTLTYAKTVEKVAEAYLDRDPSLEALIDASRGYVTTVCSLERQAQDVVRAIGALTARCPHSGIGPTWPFAEAFPPKPTTLRWRRSAYYAREAARSAFGRPTP